MVRTAAEKVLTEQQRLAPKSSLHRFGRRLNKTMKLLLAVPSDPHLKTYSTSHPPRAMTRAMPFPYGVGALGLQARMPTPGGRSRPGTAGSQRTVNRPKQSGEMSRRPSGAAVLQSPHNNAPSRPQTRVNEYRESDATLWDPYQQPPVPQMPAHKTGQTFSTTFSKEGTLMPTQEQMGNTRWDRALPELPGAYAQAPRVRSRRVVSGHRDMWITI